MRRATGAAVAGVMALVCVVALSGCRDHSLASRPANGVVPPSSTAVVATAGSADGADGAAGSTTSANGSVDSDLNAVDSQLAGLDSAMAQATQSPSDGG